ncbi:MAG: hypothetical protein A2391_03145 [Candidatus Brennerbacteria bacterium RIFOXYB1_FULL_41_13]|uniref:Uncharacterized protein n=1 Tax=Candidatus Brennerbacteria bacterium RIFOXYD1_FULL_41_16 TaxID=1797529 RepID=A0A1G1XLJ5_9BACT|nr:MAG: hypothetical protein A2391_03145 [Candidatus Brennerbacteria bacterium RIFOXYB1_FULL_41_13]OGY40480.1 MAG: hypothetical protein A2570_01890 [Candidatus Brennerbacteria bacterium RIFOXYD1_FULL_41_16]
MTNNLILKRLNQELAELSSDTKTGETISAPEEIAETDELVLEAKKLINDLIQNMADPDRMNQVKQEFGDLLGISIDEYSESYLEE